MILHPPIEITPRLLPGVSIGDVFISITYALNMFTNDGRIRYVAYIDRGTRELGIITDLHSGCQGGSLQEGLESLLSFLSACAAAQAYQLQTGRESENSNLFAEPLRSWCYEMAQEIDNTAWEIEHARETTKTLIEE